MKNKKINLRTRQAQAGIEIFLMMTMIFAFCFIISESARVEGQVPIDLNSLLPGTKINSDDGKSYIISSEGYTLYDSSGEQTGSGTLDSLQYLINENPTYFSVASTTDISVPGDRQESAALSAAGEQAQLQTSDNSNLMIYPQQFNYQGQAYDAIATKKNADGSFSAFGLIKDVSGAFGTAKQIGGTYSDIKAIYQGKWEKIIGEDLAKDLGLIGKDAPKAVADAKTLSDTKGLVDSIAPAGEAAKAAPGYMPISGLLNKYLGWSFLDPTTGIGSWLAPIFEGAIWGGVAAGIGYGLGALMGWSDNNKLALSLAMGAGVFTGMSLSNLLITQAGMGTLGASLIGWGVGGLVGVGIFLLMFKRQDTKIATFNCMAWQPPKGAKDCEKCNADLLRPCSEYRCKSIGANCAIVQGAGRDLCVSKDLGDVSPPIIKPNYDVLTKGYKYTDVKDMPPGPGFRVVGETQECVKPFTPLKFGISLNEPAQCKIDYNDTGNFDSMRYYFGESNAYEYNHTEQMVLPSAEAMKNSSMILYNDGKWTFWVRCSDAMGNYNSAAYAMRLCVDPSPDTTPPEIMLTSLNNAGCVAENQNNAVVEFYTNEPADCKWAHEDRNYDDMPYQMQCNNELYQMNAMQLYTCQAELNGIARESTKFYVRCKDQPDKEKDRNENRKSFVFELRTSDSMKIRKVSPAQDETIYGGTSPLTVQLQAETAFGCDNGKSICYYSTTGNDNDYIQFYETDSDFHTQSLDLREGKQTFFIKCVDSGGNVAINKTEFELKLETNAPSVSRVYEQNGMLKITTLKNSDCSYKFDNCDFTFPEGINMPTDNSKEHTAEWQKGQTYYIKCRDQYQNEPSGCSIIVKPEDLLLS